MVGVILEHPQQHSGDTDTEDRLSAYSVASTAATTASFASRIASLAHDFGSVVVDEVGSSSLSAVAAASAAATALAADGGTKEPTSVVLEEESEGGGDDDERAEARTAANGIWGSSWRGSGLAGWGSSLRPRRAGVGGGRGGGSAGAVRQALRDGDGGDMPGVAAAGAPDDELSAREPPLQVCSRLFVGRGQPPLRLRRLTMMQVEDFRVHGYVVVDGLISKDAAARLKLEAVRAARQGKLGPAPDTGIGSGSHPYLRRGSSEQQLALRLGHPPVDTASFAPVMAAFEELREDLHEFIHLRHPGAEYALCLLPAGSAPVPRHRDAIPDGGRSPAAAAQQLQQPPVQPRVSMLVFSGMPGDWEREVHGGCLRLWPPVRQCAGGLLTTGGYGGGGGGGGGSTAAATPGHQQQRRSPASSDAGTSFGEASECGSLRLDTFRSTTSSVVAEAGAPDHDNCSLDGLSVAESDIERMGFEWVESDGEMALDVAPVGGRCVLMLSGAVEHALLPGAADTAYVRAWCW